MEELNEEVDSVLNTKTSSRIPAPVSNLRRSASVRVRGEKANMVTSIPATPFPSIAEKEEFKEFTDDKLKYWNRNRLNISLKSRVRFSMSVKNTISYFYLHKHQTN